MSLIDAIGAYYTGRINKNTYVVKYKNNTYITRIENKEALDEYIKREKQEDERYSAEFRSKDRKVRN